MRCCSWQRCSNSLSKVRSCVVHRLLYDETVVEALLFHVLEAALRSQKQAESEDCDQVDIEHFEKILPQLVRSSTKFGFLCIN